MADYQRILLRRWGSRWGVLTVVLAALVGAGVFVVEQGGGARTRSQPTAVVLVTVDTLRADYVSYVGQHVGTTPFVDQLANSGVIFTSAYSPSSWTAPAMASLFTGLLPSSHGVIFPAIRRNGLLQQFGLSDSLVTLAESLQKAGWTTIGVPSNRNLSDRLGFGAGFDYYYGEADFLPGEAVNQQVYTQLERAFGADWRNEWKKRRTFLWVHYFDPHDPYFAREPWISRYAPDFHRHPVDFPKDLVMRTLKHRYPNPGPEVGLLIAPLYASEVSYFDAQFAQLAERLGLQDPNVLVILTADHGEEITDHGGLGHSHTLYEELVHVPLIFYWPEHLNARRTNAPVSLIDVFPTLADLLGIEVPADVAGESVLPILEGQTPKESRSLYFELHRLKNPAKAIRAGEWKLIRDERPGAATQLFNLTRDPGERNDVAASNRAQLEELQHALTQQLSALPESPRDQKKRLVNEERVKEQLRDLGYIDTDGDRAQ